MINKILFITLSNIGDVILTLPVLDVLRENFPESKITVVVGERPKEIFENNPNINRVIVYNKRSKLRERIKLFREIRKERFDMIVDLRNSFLGAILPAKHKTSPFLVIPKDIKHMRDRHLYRLMNRGASGLINKGNFSRGNSLYISLQDEEYIANLLKEHGISDKGRIVVISPGARSHIKRWSQDKFAELISLLSERFGVKVILAGDKEDASVSKYIIEHSKYGVVNFTAKTSLPQLAALLKKASCVITNDSAVLHLASYINTPVVAIFGPTDELKYGPWSKDCALAKKDIYCRPCQRAQCESEALKCLQLVKVEDVIRAAREILVTTSPRHHVISRKYDFRRILIVRTDRIGDVLLSTPVIKALRDNYPNAYIAMMVSVYAKDIVDGNPYLDEVIIYDKDGKHKSWLRSIRFALNLKEKRFDAALILHPTKRVHLVTFFAGIPKRIGYDRKCGFLLTDKIKHTKQLGEKHELEYNLDLVRFLGIEPKDTSLFMPIKPSSEEWADALFKQEGIEKTDKLLAIHPGASCPSKIWPQERFAQVSDKLIEGFGFKAFIISGPKDIKLVENLVKYMHYPVINLAGRTSVSQIASLLRRCQLLISNDSGPVHIASAVGTPVISIFGRNQRGLSPKRWGPVGRKDRILHKKIGCIECLAHNCVKQFTCLKAITVDDVLHAADSILKQQ